ncbi:hypothetical protein ABH935_010260, partial [Catenulispora sp. GAS73]
AYLRGAGGGASVGAGQPVGAPAAGAARRGRGGGDLGPPRDATSSYALYTK